MNNSISLIYYTANRVPEPFAEKVRKHLVEAAKGKPIISVSLKPMDFGDKNIVQTSLEVNQIGNSKPSSINMHNAIRLGIEFVKTKYVALCEDDCLYVPEHFDYEPRNAFAYNMNQWHLCRNIYFHRGHKVSWVTIAPTELMIRTMERRFKNHLYDIDIKLKVREELFRTEIPLVTFRHKRGISGAPKVTGRYQKTDELTPWGNAQELWNKYYGEGLV